MTIVLLLGKKKDAVYEMIIRTRKVQSRFFMTGNGNKFQVHLHCPLSWCLIE